MSLLENIDTFITTSVGQKEYAIQGIKKVRTHANKDDSTIHLTLLCNDCEVGNIINTEDNLNEKDKDLLIKLICNEQTHMLIKDNTKYGLETYKKLEELKVKIKNM